jgi:hypothetical protein
MDFVNLLETQDQYQIKYDHLILYIEGMHAAFNASTSQIRKFTAQRRWLFLVSALYPLILSSLQVLAYLSVGML